MQDRFHAVQLIALQHLYPQHNNVTLQCIAVLGIQKLYCNQFNTIVPLSLNKRKAIFTTRFLCDNFQPIFDPFSYLKDFYYPRQPPPPPRPYFPSFLSSFPQGENKQKEKYWMGPDLLIGVIKRECFFQCWLTERENILPFFRQILLVPIVRAVPHVRCDKNVVIT